jgi:hypothetical protein
MRKFFVMKLQYYVIIIFGTHIASFFAAAILHPIALRPRSSASGIPPRKRKRNLFLRRET